MNLIDWFPVGNSAVEADVAANPDGETERVWVRVPLEQAGQTRFFRVVAELLPDS